LRPRSFLKMRLLPAVFLTQVMSWCAFGQTYTISTVAGGVLPVNIPGTSAKLGETFAAPQVIAADQTGNLSFLYQNTVLRLDATTGILTLVAGNGTTGFSGDNGPATSAELNFPSGLAVDSAGNLYIADAGNNRIRKVSNGVITTVAGDGTSGFSGDNGPAISAQLTFLSGLAVDSTGNLYIAEGNLSIAEGDGGRIRKVSNGVITTVAGNGTFGFSGDNSPAIIAQLNRPAGVAVDSAGNLYIADLGNQRVRKVSNGVITTVAGNGTPGFSGDNGPATSAQLTFPAGLAVDSAGNLYIADGFNGRIRKVSNGVITTVAGNGRAGFSGDNGPATSAQLSFPSGVAVDSAGNLYIADELNNRIREVSNGVITTVAGGGSLIGENGLATSAQLNLPEDLAVDSVGNLYISELRSNRIRKVSNGVITTVAGNGTAGFSGDNGPATSAQLNGPSAVAVDSAGSLYIADYNRVRKVSDGVITTVAGNGTAGFSGDNGSATSAQLYRPGGVAVDSAGNLYIADAANYRIRKVWNGVITTVAGDGTQGFSGDNGPATSAQLYMPVAVAVDSAGDLYISDFSNRIRKVSNGVITTVVGNGTCCSILGDNGPATSAGLFSRSVAVDSAGNLYIADDNNNRIRKVSNGVISTVAGNGTQGFSGDNGPATRAQLYGPSGVAVDSQGRLYFADSSNNRIRVLTPPSASGCTYAINPGGQAFVAAGGNGTMNITAGPGCSWTAASTASWVTITGVGAGTGNGSISYQVAASTGGTRSGSLTVAGISFTVEQASASITGFSNVGSMAQLASAGYWTTTITLVNTSSTSLQARLNFFDNNGNPLALPLTFPQLPSSSGPLLASTLDRTLNAGAELVIQSTGPDSQPTIVGWAQLLANGTIGGFAVFSQAIGNSVQDAEVPLENRNASGYVLPFDNTNGSSSGVALANISPQAVNSAVTIRDDAGAVILSDTIALPAMGHTSFNLADRYASITAQRRGTLEFRTPATGQISVLGIRCNATGAFSTIPALAK
jgi:sugar lactone lactonase YvrE